MYIAEKAGRFVLKNLSKVFLVTVSIFLFSFTYVDVQAPSTSSGLSIPAAEFVPRTPGAGSFIGFYACSSSSPCPIGAADYGVNGNSTYSYKASTFVSWANFTALTIASSSTNCGGGLTECITIQQNLVDYNVFETGSHGSVSGEYWPQDVPFVTQSGSNYVIKQEDNIWNFSSARAKLGSTIYGNLLGQCSKFAQKAAFYYCVGSGKIKTTLPFEVLMNTTTGILTSGTHAGSAYVEFGIWVYHSGKLVKGSWYDEVAFTGAAASAPYMFVGGKNPGKLYNDAETVLCGPGGGSSASITSVNAAISEAYLPLGSATLRSIPHAYSAGTDTAETVSGVKMTSTVAGTGIAQSGADNNNQLW